MVYPPLPHRETCPDRMYELVRDYPFAHLFSTSAEAGHHVTRLPFAADAAERPRGGA